MAGRRPKRNLPPVSYREPSDSSEEEDSFISVVSDVPETRTPVSPSHPRFLLQETPPHPDHVLAQAAGQLKFVETVQNIVPEWKPLEPQEADSRPRMAGGFVDEDGEDDAGAMGDACRRLERFQWMPEDLDFYFAQIQTKMATAGVKKQFTKFQILSQIIPKHVIDEVKPLLRKEEDDFNGDAYKQLKLEILRIFGPDPESGMERALNRVMTGKPSQLARALVNDMCKKELDCTCCQANVLAMWKRHLPGQVKAGIADCKFDKASFNATTQLADKIWASNGATASVAAMSVAATTTTTNLDETQPGIPYPVQPEVAAVTRGRGRTRGRGNRGGRGRGGGQQPQNQQPSNQARPRGTRHPDLPAGETGHCSMHFRWGRGAFFCSDPGSCPWKNVFAAKPSK